jgi:D-alanyl-D-alanine carboxypeptidase (penicillin-binding protein 5/6)
VTPQRLGAALTGLLLAASATFPGAVAVDPTPTGSAEPTATGATDQSATEQTSQTTPPFVPCPHVRADPPFPLPSPSPMPKRDGGLPGIGGPGLATDGLAIPSGAPPPPNNTSATSWVVADLDTGEVIGSCAPYKYGAPASVQKLLLVAAFMPKLDPKQIITVIGKDLEFEPGSSAVGLMRRGKYSVETLWLGLILQSGNDAANVLARIGGGGDQAAGVAAMNAEARRLGAYDTHADTPSGLDGPNQVTTAYDLALIARACFAMPDFLKYAQTKVAKMPPQPPKDKDGFQIQNDNMLLYEYPGALGGKTGYTDLARHTYVGAAERGGRRLLVTIMGAERKPVRGWQQGAALLDWGFSVAKGQSVGRLVRPGEATPPPPRTPAPPTASPVPVQAVAGAVGGSGRPVLVGAVALAGAVVTIWLTVLVVSRRRRLRRPSTLD